MPCDERQRYCISTIRVDHFITNLSGLFERKTINPPPIVQIIVEDNDFHQSWLNERSFFMISTLYDPHLNQLAATTCQRAKNISESDPMIVGATTSSLQKIQENNRGMWACVTKKCTNISDVGLFVFGDISVKEEGQFRLRFDLFEYM